MTDYLTKPIDKTHLLRMVRKCITSALLVVALGSTDAVVLPDGPIEESV
jgi:hypothetical protein